MAGVKINAHTTVIKAPTIVDRVALEPAKSPLSKALVAPSTFAPIPYIIPITNGCLKEKSLISFGPRYTPAKLVSITKTAVSVGIPPNDSDKFTAIGIVIERGIILISEWSPIPKK